jgi:predicted acetyltransferase
MNAEPFDDHDQVGESSPEAHSDLIRLEPPSEKFIDSFFEAMEEFEAEGIPQISKDTTREKFPAYVQKLLDQAVGKNLKEGHVPSVEFWMIDADGYAGRIILGLSYTPTVERLGHHVGYAVRPSKRRRGYATIALHCLLDEARKLKVYQLMPTCGETNIASRKVIEKNGGVLVSRSPTDQNGHAELRFLIDLEAQP